MSSPKVHLLQSVTASALLYPVIGEQALYFGAAAVLIDVDHILDYIIATGDLHPRGFFVYHQLLLQNLDHGFLGLNIFHTLECYLSLLFLAHWFPRCYAVCGGMVFHHLGDFIFLLRLRTPGSKACSIIEYLIRRKRHPTSLRALFQQSTLHLEQIADVNYWLAKWGIAAVPARELTPTTAAQNT
jgi:hypothetical protein